MEAAQCFAKVDKLVAATFPLKCLLILMILKPTTRVFIFSYTEPFSGCASVILDKGFTVFLLSLTFEWLYRCAIKNVFQFTHFEKRVCDWLRFFRRTFLDENMSRIKILFEVFVYVYFTNCGWHSFSKWLNGARNFPTLLSHEWSEFRFCHITTRESGDASIQPK